MSKISKPDDKGVKRMNLNVPVELHNSFKSVTAGPGAEHDRRAVGVHQELHREALTEAEGAAAVKRAALYLRVSTVDQHPETQLLDLRAMAAQRGFEIVHEYTD